MALNVRAVYGGATSIERITRQGLGEDVLQRLASRRPVEDQEDPANLRWGAASRFSVVDPVVQEQPGYTIIWPDRNDQDEEVVPDEIEVQDYREVSRVTEVVRVENPDDANQWVEVERINSMVFAGPTGAYVRFNFNHG